MSGFQKFSITASMNYLLKDACQYACGQLYDSSNCFFSKVKLQVSFVFGALLELHVHKSIPKPYNFEISRYWVEN